MPARTAATALDRGNFERQGGFTHINKTLHLTTPRPRSRR
ncbi:Hypothetical protein CAP_8656 [Chondromyces apiculatus DSM 436]|uniref:Uncharacterized protein n=1 Tax=Chondromyces apiculatus DSM 436 TaxID=1192034 RepID=A0A017TE43_9BACT|nr:Hypothetical protein CAP_8656 [Chondromyces apiculatus DSM 436]